MGKSLTKTSKQNTLLHSAVQKEDFNKVKALVDAGTDVNNKDDFGATLLHAAVSSGRVEIVKMLIEKGAQLEVTEHVFGETPLHTAASLGNCEMVKLLLENGAQLDSRDQSGETPLNRAASNGHDTVAETLLEAGAEIDAIGIPEWTPLHQAAEHGHVEVVKLLLGRGAQTEQKNNFGRTPLCTAAHRGHSTIVKMLLAYEAKVNIENDNDGYTPLHYAARRGDAKEVEIFLELDADLESKNCFGQTPLHTAAERGLKEVVKLLLERGARLESRDYDRRTPLHAAAGKGHADVVRLLVEKGADMNAKSCHWWTPLHIAIHNTHVEVVKLLLQYDAKIEFDDNDTPVEEHHDAQSCIHLYRPLHGAVEHNNIDILKLLLKKAQNVNQTDCNGNTALHCVGLYHTFNIEIVKELISHGININVVNSEGRTALDLIVEQGNFGDITSGTKPLRKIIGFLYEQQYLSGIKDVPHTYEMIHEADKFDKIKSLSDKNDGGITDLFPIGQLRSLEEFNEIREAVNKLMEKVCRTMSKRSPNYETDHVLVGSSSCGIKCWSPDEFDYFFVLTRMSEKVMVEANRPGYVKIRMKDNSFKNYTRDGYLQIKLKDKFVDLLCDSMFTVFNEPDLQLQPISTDGAILEWNKVCTTFTLLYRSPLTNQPLKIAVDISPALKVSGKPLGISRKYPDVKYYHVVPKPANDPEIEENQRDIIWIVSTSFAEKEHIKALSQQHKDIMILAKTLTKEQLYNVDSRITVSYLEDKLSEYYKNELVLPLARYPGINVYKLFSHTQTYPGDFLDSYTLKTAFLECVANSKALTWNEHNVKEQILKIFKYISKCCKTGFMPHCYMKDVNILCGLNMKFFEPRFPLLYLREKCADAISLHIKNADIPTKRPLMMLDIHELHDRQVPFKVPKVSKEWVDLLQVLSELEKIAVQSSEPKVVLELPIQKSPEKLVYVNVPSFPVAAAFVEKDEQPCEIQFTAIQPIEMELAKPLVIKAADTQPCDM